MKRVLLALCGAAIALAQPAVFKGSVRNAASARYGLPNPGIAPGAWFVIQGRNLGPAVAMRAEQPATSLAGTSVQVAIGGQQFEVPLLAVSGGEILARMPSSVPTGEATVIVQSAAGTLPDAANSAWSRPDSASSRRV